MLNHPHGMPLTILGGHRLSMWGGGTQSSTLTENEHGGQSGLGTSAEWCTVGSVERCREASYKYIRWSVIFLRKKKTLETYDGDGWTDSECRLAQELSSDLPALG